MLKGIKRPFTETVVLNKFVCCNVFSMACTRSKHSPPLCLLYTLTGCALFSQKKAERYAGLSALRLFQDDLIEILLAALEDYALAELPGSKYLADIAHLFIIHSNTALLDIAAGIGL